MNSRSTLKNIARGLRHDQTDTERLMWSFLRAKRFEGFKFRRQHPVAAYVLDFYCGKFKLCIELDGGQHHTPEGIEKDQRRDEVLRGLGVTVLRFEDRAFFKNRESVMGMIWEELMRLSKSNAARPSPSLSPGTGRGTR
jgi:very-short-patch-repair endonuclease